MRTCQSKKKDPPLSPATRKARKEVVDELARVILDKQNVSEGKRSETYGYVKVLLAEKRRIYPWLKRGQLYERIKMLKKRRSIVEALPSNTASTAGCPKGSTKDAMLKKTQNMRILASERLCERVKKQREQGRCSRWSYNKIHNEVMHEFGLQDEPPIKYDLIQKRLKRECNGKNKPLLVSVVEPILLTLAQQRQEAGQPLKPSEGLALANSLIFNTTVQSKLESWQMAHFGHGDGVLSKGFWNGFTRCHKDVLSSTKGFRLAACRKDWSTYENIEMMYELVYTQMVNAGVAKLLPESEQYWVDRNGTRVESESQAEGLKVRHEITHPEWIIFGDEVGNDLDQSDNGHVGGQTFCVTKRSKAALTSSTTSGRFTIIGFTAASWDPVMCLLQQKNLL